MAVARIPGVFQRRTITLLSLLALCLSSIALPAQPATAQPYRPVYAFYYIWYDLTTWQIAPDVPVTPYMSTDPEASARHIGQAQSVGIDAFIASWYGPEGGQYNQTQANFLMLLDQAAQRNFKAAIDFETASPFMKTRAKVIEGLKYAVNTLAQHPGYLRHNGKPILFFWRNDRFSPSDWVAIRNQVDPNRTTIWMAEGVTAAWLGPFDGLHLYNVAWSRDFGQTAARFSKATRDRQKIWAATVKPGWNDTKVKGRPGTYIKDRENGAFYRRSFVGAAASNPDMLLITSFNEWMEGTHIEPSTTFGDAYLNLSRDLIAQYRAGTLLPTPTPLPTAVPTPSPVPTAVP
jgi:Glycosyl hydrolase family 99